MYKAVIFLGESLHCGYKRKLEEIGKIRFNSLNLTKILLIKWKKSTKFTTHKIEKRRKGKKIWYRLIYVCTLNRIGRNML
jgi:hypothetical protein